MPAECSARMHRSSALLPNGPHAGAKSSLKTTAIRVSNSRLWQPKGYHRLPGCGEDVLFSIFALIGNRIRVRIRGELGLPQQFAGFRIVGMETLVVSRSYEQQSARRGHGAADVVRPRVHHSDLLQRFDASKGHPPGHVTGAHVDGEQFAPGWRLAWPARCRIVDRAYVLAHKRHLTRIPRLADRPGGALLRRNLSHHLLHSAAVVRVYEVVAQLGVVATSAPIESAVRSWKNHRVSHAHR